MTLMITKADLEGFALFNKITLCLVIKKIRRIFMDQQDIGLNFDIQ